MKDKDLLFLELKEIWEVSSYSLYEGLEHLKIL
jgi:hypothetical protein